MSFYQITDTVKKLLLDNVKEKNISVDFTLGRGNDTIFLSENFNYVYSFDLQKECIELKNIQNVKLILDSHENVDKYIDGFDCGMYNLGYLPGSNKEITTNAESTLISLYKAVNILNIGGFISIVLYIPSWNFSKPVSAVPKKKLHWPDW